MAQHKAAKKSVRHDVKERLRNRGWKSKIKTARKKLETALERNETKDLGTLFREYVSIIDRATSKGVLHKNTASRKKTNMAQRLKRAGETGSSKVSKLKKKAAESKAVKAVEAEMGTETVKESDISVEVDTAEKSS